MTTTQTSSSLLRVVTLNCASEPKTVGDVRALQPDIVLLQESPGDAEVRQLARRLFGKQAAVLWGVDASVVARGEVTPVPVPGEVQGNCVHARVRVKSGEKFDVISLRLLPSPVRLDLWNPECWRTYRENRQRRREELRRITRHWDAIVPKGPLIVGGDFNAPPGDAVFRLLRPRLQDAFTQAGLGWGNTVLNNWPVLRIDQIWVSDQFQPYAVWATPTEHSDHRLVVCDLRVPGNADIEPP